MNVLVIAPHPDDESLGCGGTLCKHTARGDRAVAVYLTSGELGLKHLPREKAWSVRESEAREAAKILRLAEVIFLRRADWSVGDEVNPSAKALRVVLERESPGLIYLPHPGEWHPDHQAAFAVVRAALGRGRIQTPTLRGYEVWTPLSRYDHVEDITSFMSRKLRAVRAHSSQLKEFDYESAIRGLNRYRGALAAKCRYAEVFQLLSLPGKK